MLQRLRISTKLAILVAIPLVSLLTIGYIVGQTVERVRVGGEVYREIVDRKDVIADVLPPPMYLVETNLLVHQLATGASDGTAGVDRTADLTARIESLRTEYETRRTFWLERISENDPVRVPLFEQSNAPALELWTAYEEEFLPALSAVQAARAGGAASQLEAAETQLSTALRKIDAAYASHRAGIDLVVAQTRADLLRAEQDADALLRRQMLLLALAVAGIIAVVGFAGVVITRSIRQPILTLGEAAETDARDRLPELVEIVRHLPVGAPLPELAPHPVDASPEINQLASSFDHLRKTALELASGEARLRQNVAEMFVNLGRRNQNLLNRTLSFISQLEEHERDPDNLDNLFRLDHLVTRMRRNAESLLVLAGNEPSRTWSAAVEVGDVVRGALSEIEPFDRVDIGLLEPVEIRGSAAADLSHLVAELVENATTFSPPSTQVSVVGRFVPDGYVLAISDQGIGMTRTELEDANRRLADPASFETSSSMVLGLFVVSRLAARNGISVQLSDSPSDGVTAKVKLPFELLEGGRPDQQLEPAASGPAALGPMTDPAADVPSAVAPPPPPPPADAGPATPTPATPTPANPTPANPTPSPFATTPSPQAGAILLPDGTVHRPAGIGAPAVGDPASGLHPAAPAPPASSPVLAAGPPTAAPDGTADPSTDRPLSRRRPGAQMPDTGPALLPAVPVDTRSPEDVRSALSRFQLGVTQGRATPVDPGSDAEPPAAVAPSPPAPGSVASPPMASPPAAPGRTAPAEPAPATGEPPAMPAQPGGRPLFGDLPNGGAAALSRRVRGAQLPDTGPAGETPGPAVTSSPDDVRFALSAFQQGQSLAASSAEAASTPPRTPDDPSTPPGAAPGAPGN